jgi:hypothetical protein
MVCVDWPESEQLSAFRQKVESEIGRQLTLCDIQKHDDEQIRGNIGCWESFCATVWHRIHLDHNIKIYVIAHELGHALCEIQGYPRIRLSEDLQETYTKTNNRNLRNYIYAINSIARLFSDIVLDPSADEKAYLNGLFSKSSLKYLRTSLTVPSKPSFLINRKVLNEGFNRILRACTTGRITVGWLVLKGFDSMLQTIADSAIYTNKRLCLSTYGLWDKNVKGFRQYPTEIKEVADELIQRISKYDLTSIRGCRNAELELIKYLNTPAGIFQIVSKE